jgi:Protein of unknown function (DUF3014).
VEHLDLNFRSEADELNLRPEGEELPPPTAVPVRSNTGPVALAAVIVLALGLGTIYYVSRQPSPRSPTPAVQPQPAAAPTAPQPTPLGGEPEAVSIPPLDESDAVVRMLARMLSENPTFVAWLASDDLIRTFTLTVVKVADGQSPATNLRMMRPRASFSVRRRGEDTYLDARSYERYTPLANAVSSIDPAGAARLYATLKPRIEDAYRELGYTNTPFDRTLERAIVTLLETTVPDKPLLLQHGRATEYLYVDPALERLTKAQKHLLRLGPRNAREVQASLRNIASALGIPPDRLPPVP